MTEKIRIQIVSDNEAFRDVVARFVALLPEAEVCGLVTTHYIDEDWVAMSPPPNIVLVDLTNLALTAIRHLRRILPNAGIFALAITDLAIYRSAALQAGADKFLSNTNINVDLLQEIKDFHFSQFPS